MSEPIPDATKVKRIGLLFVHGIGEQRRFEHLTATARDFAELIKQQTATSVSLVDRTEIWNESADRPVPGPCASTPLSIHLRGELNIDLECHEVWWADLGARKSFLEGLQFWAWGLGQWAAPILRELDPTGVDDASRPRPLTRLPRTIKCILEEIGIRARLLLAGLCAVFTFFSWSLLKQLANVFGKTPSPTLIYQYLGDIRTYERRAEPNKSIPSDPGQPRRVAIRRRMVTQMVAIATRGYDHWFICAHSLGSVVAYNGLTELGHTLPNYLDERSWKALPAELKEDGDVILRDPSELHQMMPARPPWLAPDDVINREALFAGLGGFLTYGSPLDKFAAIWPRIVATADDRLSECSPFPQHCSWVNLHNPTDPVSGQIDAYDAKLRGLIPPVVNISSGMDLLPGLSHVRYFFSSTHARTEKYWSIVAWLLDHKPQPDEVPQSSTDKCVALVMFAGIVFFLAVFAGLCFTFAYTLLCALFAGIIETPDIGWDWFHRSYIAAVGFVCSLTLVSVASVGCLRWWRESRFDHHWSVLTRKSEATRRLLCTQRFAAGFVFWLGIPLGAIFTLACDAYDREFLDYVERAFKSGLAIVSISLLVQAWINSVYSGRKD